MNNNENKIYTLMVYNTATRQNEEIKVTQEVYHAYRRTGWGIKNNDTSFFEHEIQMSGLIGGEDGAYENFREFIETENTPDNLVIKVLELEALNKALSTLTDTEKALIKALYFSGLTEREYAKATKLPQKTINNRKMAIIRKLKKIPDFKK